MSGIFCSREQKCKRNSFEQMRFSRKTLFVIHKLFLSESRRPTFILIMDGVERKNLEMFQVDSRFLNVVRIRSVINISGTFSDKVTRFCKVVHFLYFCIRFNFFIH